MARASLNHLRKHSLKKRALVDLVRFVSPRPRDYPTTTTTTTSLDIINLISLSRFTVRPKTSERNWEQSGQKKEKRQPKPEEVTRRSGSETTTKYQGSDAWGLRGPVYRGNQIVGIVNFEPALFFVSGPRSAPNFKNPRARE